MEATPIYRAQAFAKRSGVTVRTLHHYDRLGLLKPRHRTDAGYRIYTDRDLVRLEQIVVFKFLGFSLSEIKGLLDEDAALGDVLARQLRALQARRRQLDGAIRALADAERSLQRGGDPDWSLFRKVIEEIEMQNDTKWEEWAKQYYTPEAQAKVSKLREKWNPDVQAQVSRQWADLIADVTAALGEDPASDRAQALAARWRELVKGFTGGDASVQQGLNRMWADQANWPDSARSQFAVDPRVQAFIVAAFQVKRE